MPVVIVLLVLIVLAELFLLMLRCRREHPGWKLLRQYRYAHRGYHDKPHIPENSMAAFRRAIEHGYGAELDVHLMKDGRLAVIHDASLKRTAGADVLVEDLTAEELKQYRLEGTQEQIPLLEEVLPLFQGKTPLIIELTNVATQPDFIAYRFSDRENLCLRLCHKVYHVQEVNWTIRAKEEMEAAEQAGNLVIFECFDPEV